MVGEVNDGWRVANSLLAHERLGTANPMICYDALDRIRKIARATGMSEDRAFRDRLAEAELETVTLAALFSHAVTLIQAKGSLGVESSAPSFLRRARKLLHRISLHQRARLF